MLWEVPIISSSCGIFCNVDTIQPMSQRASCKHQMTKLLLILIIKDKVKGGKMISGFSFHLVIGLPFQMVVFHLVYGISVWHFLQLNLFTSPSGRKIHMEWPGSQAQKSDTKVLKPDCSKKLLPVGSSERSWESWDVGTRIWSVCGYFTEREKETSYCIFKLSLEAEFWTGKMNHYTTNG